MRDMCGIERAGEQEMTTFPMISYREFDRWLEQGQIGQLVDLREPWMYERERLWGIKHPPLWVFPLFFSAFFFCLQCRMHEINREATVVFYCDRGAKSMLVCRDLWKMGYRAVDLAGGMLQYKGKYIDRSPLPALE